MVKHIFNTCKVFSIPGNATLWLPDSAVKAKQIMGNLRKCIYLQISYTLLLLVMEFMPEEQEKIPSERNAHSDLHKLLHTAANADRESCTDQDRFSFSGTPQLHFIPLSRMQVYGSGFA